MNQKVEKYCFVMLEISPIRFKNDTQSPVFNS
jgi:hypothetical protein